MSTVGLFYGGRSVEHEVSVVTAMQVLAAMPEDVRAVPVYIAKSGHWYSGDALRDLDAYRDIDSLLSRCTPVTLRPEPGAQLLEVGSQRRLLLGGTRGSVLSRAGVLAALDVAMPLVHGTGGEDGTLPALFELAGIAYTGCGVAAGAVSMDKRASKAMFRSAGLPVLDDVLIRRQHWNAEPESVLDDVERRLSYPVFVKPLSLGSSIGVTRAADPTTMREALDTALTYDTACIVERAQDGIIEVNCAVLGRYEDVRISACEQPRATGLLSYEDKYLSKSAKGVSGMKGAERVIPAPIGDALTKRIEDAAATAFHAIGAEGVARVDFLVDPEAGAFVVNEINTVPGSLSFYLWEPAGLAFPDLLRELLLLAEQRHEERRATTSSIGTWLLSGRPQS